ncbi:MAG TPA: alpha/beta hydrolase domain-containing protein, partial [Chloroflexota bacterium]
MLTRLDATATPFAAGREFGAAGDYEQVTGTAVFAVDPSHPANASIVDLALAPRQPDGRVTFEADLRILRPADPRRGNRRLVLDLVNRGNPVALRNLAAGPAARSDAESDGWLLARGYTLLSCGWQHNVPRGTRRLGLHAPAALDPDGRGLTGQVRAVHQVNVPTQVVGIADEPSGAEHTPYPVADPRDPTATLIERDYPLATGRVVSRERWRFGRLDQGQLVPDRTHVYYADGFVPGKVYEIIYTAEGAPVTGLGFAAVRDAVSFLRFGSRATGNPCADTLDYALAFGASQTGRLARHMLYAGFCVDEAGRLVVDGVLTLIAGPMRTEANWRFGQPSFIGSDSPGFGFPFTDGSQADPRHGSTDGLLQRLSRTDQVPKVMHINTSAEYANLACALIHLSADGSTDVEIPDDVRIYHLAGTHHGGGGLPLTNRLFSGVATYYN